jgi:catechol 2,3-dioxygenase-like lactoylglutathione lyase family enzyme
MDVTEPLGIRVQCVVVDAADPRAQARFWSGALGWRVTHDTDDEAALEPPEGSPANDVAPDILFVRVPEGKTVKNRLHFDLRPDDQAAHVSRLLALGATRAEVGQTGEERWVVLADPEGNEFCVLPPLPPEAG